MSESNQLASEVDFLREFFGDLQAAPHFTQRATNIPGDLRVAWRLSVLCLLLRRGRANTLALEHLHVLWWAVRSEATRSLLLRWFRGEGRPDEMLVRFDPSLSVTLDLAIGQGLAEVSETGTASLTVNGAALADAVLSQDDALTQEKAFLAALPTRISRQQVQSLLESA